MSGILKVQPCPEPPEGEAEQVKVAFSDCLQLVARAHEQELEHLRTENARLHQILAAEQPASSSQAPLKEAAEAEEAASAPNGPPGDARLQQGPTTEEPLASSEAPLREESEEAAVAPAGRSDEDGTEQEPRPPQSVPPLLPGLCEVISVALPGTTGIESEDPPDVMMPVDTEGAGAKHAVSDGSRRNSAAPSANEKRFTLIQQWQDTSQDTFRAASKASTRRPTSTFRALRDITNKSLAQHEKQEKANKYISFPSSPWRLAFDMFGAALIFYDLVVIPLGAFSLPNFTILQVMDWVTLIFWTLNVPMSVQVGFTKDGVVNMNFKDICSHYLRTWFLPDLAVVLPDWIITLAQMTGSDSPASSSDSFSPDGFKLLRMLRLARMVRLVRLLKVAKILQNLNDLIESEYTNIAMNIAKMIFLLLVINHYVCCVWYLIGTLMDGPNTWVVHFQFDSMTWYYQYATSFHWAITQFTPASMHVQPQNIFERTFAILVVVFALVCFSYVVGSITGSLSQLRGLQEESYKQFWLLRRYLKQNKVTFELTTRITRYLDHAWQSQRQNVDIKDSKIFKLLSEQLQSELQCEIWMPYLKAHDVFSEVADKSHMTLRRMAAKAMQCISYAFGDHVFLPEKALYMYIPVSGCMKYVKTDWEQEEKVDDMVMPKEFVAEPVLWTSEWVHLGMLTAGSETGSEVLTVDPKKFLDVMLLSPEGFCAAAEYGREYVRKINEMDETVLSDVMRGVVKTKMTPGFRKSASRISLAATDIPITRTSSGPSIWNTR